MSVFSIETDKTKDSVVEVQIGREQLVEIGSCTFSVLSSILPSPSVPLRSSVIDLDFSFSSSFCS